MLNDNSNERLDQIIQIGINTEVTEQNISIDRISEYVMY